MPFDPLFVLVACVPLSQYPFAQVPWIFINVCGKSLSSFASVNILAHNAHRIQTGLIPWSPVFSQRPGHLWTYGLLALTSSHGSYNQFCPVSAKTQITLLPLFVINKFIINLTDERSKKYTLINLIREQSQNTNPKFSKVTGNLGEICFINNHNWLNSIFFETCLYCLIFHGVFLSLCCQSILPITEAWVK